MTDATEVDAAVGRLSDLLRAADHCESHGAMVKTEDLRTLITDHRQQAAVIEALKNANENKAGLVQIAEGAFSKQAEALSETRAVLDEAVSGLEYARKCVSAAPEDTWGRDANIDLDGMQISGSWPVKNEHLSVITDVITRAQALKEKQDG